MNHQGIYPPEWQRGEIQRAMHERAGWRCEHCGMAFEPGTTRALTARNTNGRPVVLTTHHLDGNPANCDWRNLLSCCQRCHLHIQARWKPGDVLPLSWPGPPDWLVERYLPYQMHPQLALPGYERERGGSRE